MIIATYGIGELRKYALDADCLNISIGIRGSATDDGVSWTAKALGDINWV